MWVIEGPFDGAETGTLPALKSKLLKPGRTYPIGRKAKLPLQLVINHPKVSHEHVTFSVGAHSVDDTSNPLAIPTLRIFNHRPKMIQFERDRTRVIVNPSTEVELQHGDYIALVSGVYVKIIWRPVCCLVPTKSPSIPFHSCASLGIKVVASVSSEVTHHLVPLLSATAAIASSALIPAQLVTPGWLTELLRLSDAPYEVPQSQPIDPGAHATRCTLEYEFALPPEEAYRPPFDPALPPALKGPGPWAPSAARQNLFAGWRFVLVHAGREPDPETRALVERGGGEYEALDVSAGGPKRIQQTLERNARKAQKGICVVGKVDTLKTAAAGSWSVLTDVLKASNLRILDSTVLPEAVLFVDASRLDSTQGAETEATSVRVEEAAVDNQVQEENAPKRRPLRRRVTPASRATSTPPDPESEVPAPAPVPVAAAAEAAPSVQDSRRSEEPEGGRRKPLVRRLKTSRIILGVDDPSFSDLPPPDSLSSAPNAAPSIEPDPTSVPVPPTPSTLGRPSRLKRRTRADDAPPLNPILAGLQKELAEADLPPPPLKKFRALFDETDPDRVPAAATSGALFSGGIVEESQEYTQLRTQTAVGQPRSAVVASGSGPRGLVAVPEEEEESESAVGPAPPRPAGAGVDIDMMDVPVPQRPDDSTKPASKSSKPTKPPSSTQERQKNGALSSAEKTQGGRRANAGAAPGKPDTDADFLRALASTRRGKKHEDDFDREFNELRISKPDLERVRAQEEQERQAEDWKLLADFGDETGVRGNFMVIVEMEVPEHRAGGSGSSRPQSREPERAEWRGKPDFKAFRKKNSFRSQSAVELVVNDENDYGMGSAYWKGGSQSQSQPEIFSQDEPPITFLQHSQTQNRGFLRPPSQASAGAGGSSSNKVTRGQSTARSTRAASTEPAPPRGQSQSRGVKAEPDDETDIVGKGKGKERARSSSRARSAANGVSEEDGRKEQPLFLETLDEEDDEGAAAAAALGGLGPEELEEIDLDLDADEEDEDEGEPEETRTRGQTTRRAPGPGRKASSAPSPAQGRKRVAAVLDDDSDTGMTFRGFAGRKKVRAK